MLDPLPAVGPPRSNLRGILWMLIFAFIMSFMWILIRHVSADIHPFEIAFFRQVLGFVLAGFWVWRAGLAALRTSVFHLHFVRSILAYGGLVGSYYAVRLVSIADTQALQFTLPFFTFVFAAWVLNETIRSHRVVTTIIGFVGALIIIRPGFVDTNIGMLIALGASALFAGSDVTNRYLSGRDAVGAIMFYGFVIQLPIGIATSIPGWVTPSLAELPLITMFGVSAVAAHWCLTHAFSVAETSLVSPVLYLRLPFAALIGFVFFDQVSDLWTWIGAAVMIASTVYCTRVDARVTANQL